MGHSRNFWKINRPQALFFNGAITTTFFENIHLILPHYVGQKMYLGGFYEVLKMGTDTVIYKIKVTDLEFGKREDAIPFCRIWGKVEDTNIESYLLAQECFPVSKNS